MVCSNNLHISVGMFYQSKDNMLNESSHDRNSDAISIAAGFSDDQFFFNDIFNKFEENISEEQNPDVLSNLICRHHAFVSSRKHIQSEA